ncbi:MAG TPA: cyclic nucleotide-binding domain-containing protein [Streptosporangiaceae bacterium]|nr:cyclic nucleotide-binding domain-containing protein [Streptosporangiaceae bacterium]
MPQTLEPLLRRHEFFAGMDREYLALIAGCARNVVFGDGAFLFREGDPAQAFYLVRDGAVALEVTAPGRVVTVQTLGAGEMVGFSWLMGPHRWHFDGRAVGRLRAVEMDGACLRAKCEADPRLGFDLMQRFALLASRRLQAARLQILDVYGHAPAG